MKWYHWLAIAIAGAILFWPKKKSGLGSGAGTTLPEQYGIKINAIVISQDPGNAAAFDTDPKNYEAVGDQQGYPGWYRSKKDGSWYNPDTSDFYSAGSSPARVGQSYYDLHPEERPQIDLNAPPVVTGTPPREGEVIY